MSRENTIIQEKWRQIVTQLGENIYGSLNTPEMIGTNLETGYLLMFFNATNHNGKATVISSETDRTRLKTLLECAIKEVNGPKATIVEPDKFSN